jgi:hypothetical protein
MSAVWRYFKISNTDESKAQCSICNELFSRGGNSKKTYTTSPLVTHLERKHNDAYLVVKKAQDELTATRTETHSKSNFNRTGDRGSYS